MTEDSGVPARVLSINVSLAKTLRYQGRAVATGIFKEPIAGKVALRKLNLDGDQQADLTVHGGQDKALYGDAKANKYNERHRCS